MSFLKNLFKKKSKQQPIKKADTKPVLPDFVERYVLDDPKSVILVPELARKSDTMSVLHEDSPQKDGFTQGVSVPTSIMLPFMCELRRLPGEFIAPAKLRTIYLVHLTQDLTLYVLPELPKISFKTATAKKTYNIKVFNKKDKEHTELKDNRGWSSHFTPAIRAAMLQITKEYK